MRVLMKLVVILVCVQRGAARRLSPAPDQKPQTALPDEDRGSGEATGATNATAATATAANATAATATAANATAANATAATATAATAAANAAAADSAAAPLPARRPRRSAPAAPCGLRSVLLQVRHLGLGYDSDESVLFKYCGGACPHVRSNHDLTLANLLLSGALPRPAPGEPRPDAPCCRPTHHEDAAFLDNAHRWHKVEKLSAAGCSCVG
ncbi:Artemin [Liparis tanakae]|uniref:Artemin n=1 Tax=Liparis tanakae TaxID=230148 RepID=A0A4Z2F0P1_9TELE|nr:Artemin [Liparis tanakae]